MNLLHLASVFSKYPGTTLLYSGGNYSTSKQSMLWLFPIETITITSHDYPWKRLQEKLGPLKGDPIPKWVGFLSYELGSFSDPEKKIEVPHSDFPLAYFQRCALVIVLDHASGKATLHFDSNPVGLSAEQEQCITELRLVKPIIEQEAYTSQIQEIQERIREGEVYQINLSHEILLKGKSDPFGIFQQIVKENPAPFSAYMHHKDFSIVSSSPERLLCKEKNRLQTCPIKGTVPRGKTPEEDAVQKEKLVTSVKERSELLMITDLARNDLGKVSEKVAVEGLFCVEGYTNVYHMHSVVTSIAKPYHPLELIRSCFPGGSITGCPKLKAQELIAEIEKRPRGIYTGSIGYFLANGDFDFNIAIRTLLFKDERVSLQLGGAIVIDSDPIQEYEETLHKGSTLLRVLGLDLDLYSGCKTSKFHRSPEKENS